MQQTNTQILLRNVASTSIVERRTSVRTAEGPRNTSARRERRRTGTKLLRCAEERPTRAPEALRNSDTLNIMRTRDVAWHCMKCRGRVVIGLHKARHRTTTSATFRSGFRHDRSRRMENVLKTARWSCGGRMCKNFRLLVERSERNDREYASIQSRRSGPKSCSASAGLAKRIAPRSRSLAIARAAPCIAERTASSRSLARRVESEWRIDRRASRH